MLTKDIKCVIICLLNNTFDNLTEVSKMNEREKKVIEAIAKAIPNLDEFSKGYVSGYLAAKEEEKKPEEEVKTDEKSAEK